MKKSEIKIIIDRIRANYPNSVFTSGIMDEWEHVLEQYDYEDVSRELDDFLKANYTVLLFHELICTFPDVYLNLLVCILYHISCILHSMYSLFLFLVLFLNDMLIHIFFI